MYHIFRRVSIAKPFHTPYYTPSNGKEVSQQVMETDQHIYENRLLKLVK